ncbi:MAG TPA: hypothetical protein VGR45_04745 [Stellaceae bacterium]|nr:hypothetical protein [Stellaceae bacterium]
MSLPVRLSIIVGVQHAQDNLPAILDALQPEARSEVEIIICHTPADPDVPTLVGNTGGVMVVCSPEGSLIPHLWRDGILAASGERVGTTTAHCIPAADWVDALLSADLGEAAVLGGTIENDPRADAKARAIFLQRYAAFSPPQRKREIVNPAADNALYRRSDLMRHRDLLQRGFWEPSFHARLRAEGLRLALDPSLRVVHRNRYSAGQYMGQRLAHGREFGLARARARSFSRQLLLVLLAPGVFPLLLARILRQAFGTPELRKQLATAWLWLPWFVLAWAVGEASGYLAGLGTRKETPRID